MQPGPGTDDSAERKRAVVPRLVVGAIAVLTAACASQPEPVPFGPGFVVGFLNGLVVPMAFVGSLFDGSIRIYAFPNAGVSYDSGFLLGLVLWGGGGAAATAGNGTDGEDGEDIDRLRRKVRRLRRRLRGG